MNFVPDTLHFLRIEWFFALMPIVAFLMIALNHKTRSISWKKICDANLLPHILINKQHKTSRFPIVLTGLIAILCVIAAAGPVWKKLPTPVFRDQSSLIIAIDLSRSMNASDIKPTRLSRAKLKLTDLLNQRKGGQTALIVYAANAFTVTPLTTDTATIINLIASLETSMMPAQGSNVTSALDLSAALLTQAGAAEGDVLLITDSIQLSEIPAVKRLSKKGHRLTILGVGTPSGGPIVLDSGFLQDKQGAIVIPKLNIKTLQAAALAGHGLYLNMQAGDEDINKLTDFISHSRSETESIEVELTADLWHEEGPWLLLVVLPLVALLSRRGIIVLIVAIIIPMPEPVYAFSFSDLWLNQNQRGMAQFENGEHNNAAKTFTQNDWKASAFYRDEQYEDAIASIESSTIPPNSNTLYNKANALAKLQRYEEAISTYDEALSLNPNNEDAMFNRDLVEKKLAENDPKQDQSQKDEQDKEQDKQKQDEQQASDDKGEKSDDENSQDGHEAQKDSEDESKEDQQNKNSKQSAEDQNNEDTLESQPEADEKKEELAEQNKENEAQNLQQKDSLETTEAEKANEQWLKRIVDDPGGLLRRKFKYQYQAMPNQHDSKQPW